jgi:hypothetical protein
MLYYLKLTWELEDRIERKAYRQGKVLGGVYVGRARKLSHRKLRGFEAR